MDKRETSSQTSNYSSSTLAPLENQPIHSQGKSMQGLAPRAHNMEARWVIDRQDLSSDQEYQDHAFLSISNYFEDFFASKVAQKQAKISQKGGLKNQNADEFMKCFCGRRYKLSRTFQQHIKESHEYAVESVEYLHNRLQLERRNVLSAKLQSDDKVLVSRIRNSSCKQLFLPDELKNIIPQKQKQAILDSATRFIQENSKHIQKLGQQNKQTPSQSKDCLFTQSFLEGLRSIVLKHVQVFNRRVSIFLKNSSYKDVMQLYIFSLLEVISASKKHKKIKILVPLSVMLEKQCEEFLEWINHNYKAVFQKKSIFYQYIELAPDQKFTEVERVNKNELFTKQYLLSGSANKQSHFQLKSRQFLLQNFARWAKNNIE